MATTRIQLCGRLTAEVEGERLEERLPGHLGRILFAYLALHRLREVSREQMVETLWADGADAGLAPLLSKLRRLVPIVGRDRVRMALPADTWIDLEAAAEALHRAESALARGDPHGAYGPARVTQHIAMRGFLAGYENAWAAGVQRQLDGMHARSLEILTAACLEIGGAELNTAERAARRLVTMDPYGEPANRLLMDVLARRGDRAGALRAYAAFSELLRDELGASPSPETQRLHRQLLS